MRCTSLAIVALVLANSSAIGAEPAPCAAQPDKNSQPWVSLFDGKSLAGWNVTGGCQATVEDGAILLKEGNGMVISQKTYADFVLEIEWKALKPDAWDSGVFFRCEQPSGKAPWPKVYQANLRKGMEGNVGGLKEATSSGLTKAGQWNRFKLTLVGDTAALEINGQPAWKTAGVANPSGHIGLQCEVPGGGQFLFRNIRIQQLGGKR